MANRPSAMNVAMNMSCRWCGKTPRDMKRHRTECEKRPRKRASQEGTGMMGAATKQRADELAEQLRAAGLDVERTDYDPLPGERDSGSRHYVIVRDGESRAEGQVNDRLPEGSFSGYGGPDGEALLARVRAILS